MVGFLLAQLTTIWRHIMVMRIEQAGPETNPVLAMRHHGWHSGQSHTGQDPLSGIRIVHSRVAQQQSEREKSPQHFCELGERCTIIIDEPLLTGNLDQDISILNIVA
jgi:hypothetical protein